MKIKITATLDIDVDAWMDIYDVERGNVRADVNEWAFHVLHSAAQDNGVVKDPA